ncbi:MAG: hypothetical protein K9M02_14095 [Thiohalocapsa sp.]|nr:hypothetical protein [Thiohalocapsa sp.]
MSQKRNGSGKFSRTEENGTARAKLAQTEAKARKIEAGERNLLKSSSAGKFSGTEKTGESRAKLAQAVGCIATFPSLAPHSRRRRPLAMAYPILPPQ